jgi:tight adherence protein B
MDEFWIIYALVFGAALVGVQAIYWIVFPTRRRQKAVNRRLALGEELRNPKAVLEALQRERGFMDYGNPTLTRMNDWLVQTGLQIRGEALVAVTVAVAIVFLVIWAAIIGLGVTSFILSALSGVGAVFLYLRRKRKKRIEQFAEQLPDAVDIIVRGVRVGHPLSVALSLVAREMPDPTGSEFGMTSDEINFGAEIKASLENLYRRVGQDDLLFLAIAINVQNATGGNLAEVLSRLARLVRQRIKVRLKIRSLSAEGRLSAILLSLMPFILFGAINLVASGYYGAVRNHPATIPVLVVGLALLGIGNLIMHRMVHFKF